MAKRITPRARRVVETVMPSATKQLVHDSATVRSAAMNQQLTDIYARLYARFGAQYWWPGDGAFEVIVGAILTQNTAWTNVEKAMTNLKRARLLTPARMHRATSARLARLIRPSGYFNLKARKLKAFTRYLFAAHRGALARLFRLDTAVLRQELLAVYGIGPETADSIILYAARQPIFVIDAYTRRIMARLGLARDDASYDELQRLFMEHLPREEPLFNEYHALLVALGKTYCAKRAPRCVECPLVDVCPTGQKRLEHVVTGSIHPSFSLAPRLARAAAENNRTR